MQTQGVEPLLCSKPSQTQGIEPLLCSLHARGDSFAGRASLINFPAKLSLWRADDVTCIAIYLSKPWLCFGILINNNYFALNQCRRKELNRYFALNHCKRKDLNRYFGLNHCKRKELNRYFALNQCERKDLNRYFVLNHCKRKELNRYFAHFTPGGTASRGGKLNKLPREVVARTGWWRDLSCNIPIETLIMRWFSNK